MPIPTTVADLSTTASANYPAGSESPNQLDDYHRALASIVRQVSDAKADTSHTQASSTISDSTAAGRALLTAADASAQRTALGLGSAATLTAGTSANNAVQLDGSAKLPAVDGSQLTNIGKITLGTPVASTSGSAIDFTAIPSGTKRITVSLSSVSTSGPSIPIIQIGDSGGIETTSYSGAASTVPDAAANAVSANSNGFKIAGSWASTAIVSGVATLALLDSSTNTWAFSCNFGRHDASTTINGGGVKALSAVLDRVRITTFSGSDTFDAGSINIIYE